MSFQSAEHKLRAVMDRVRHAIDEDNKVSTMLKDDYLNSGDLYLTAGLARIEEIPRRRYGHR
jgi:hypothetical protein